MRVVLLATIAWMAGCATCADQYPYGSPAWHTCVDQAHRDSQDWADIARNSGSGSRQPAPQQQTCVTQRDYLDRLVTTCN